MLEFSRNSISIAGFEIKYYGIAIMLGALLGVIIAGRREKRLGLPKDTALDIALLCIPAAIVCARLYYVAFRWDAFKGDLLSIFNLRTGGLAIYGGLIGAVAAGYVYSRVKKLAFPLLCDLAAPSIALGQAVGRWGNYFNQEAYGIEITIPALQFFPVGVFIDAENAWHCATFFYESAWCLGLAAFLLIAERRDFFRKSGDMMLWYMLLYGLERAIVEGLRTDSLFLGSLRVSQALSIALILAAAVIFAIRQRRRISLSAAILAGAAMLMSLANLIYPALCAAGAAVIATALAYWQSPKNA